MKSSSDRSIRNFIFLIGISPFIPRMINWIAGHDLCNENQVGGKVTLPGPELDSVKDINLNAGYTSPMSNSGAGAIK